MRSWRREMFVKFWVNKSERKVQNRFAKFRTCNLSFKDEPGKGRKPTEANVFIITVVSCYTF